MNAKASTSGPTIESLVADGVPASGWTALFGDRKQAALHFANVYQSRFGLNRAKGRCIACDGEESDSVAQYFWEAKFVSGVGMSGLQVALLFLGRLSVKVKHDRVGFQTFHPMCGSCAKKLRVKRALAGLMKGVSIVVLCLAGMMALMSWGVLLTETHPSREDSQFMIGGTVSTILCIASLAALFSLRFMRVRSPIRFLGGRPYSYKRSKLISFLK